MWSLPVACRQGFSFRHCTVLSPSPHAGAHEFIAQGLGDGERLIGLCGWAGQRGHGQDDDDGQQQKIKNFPMAGLRSRRVLAALIAG